jgi:DHA2 family multidrug resistance protein-like MFS transporter
MTELPDGLPTPRRYFSIATIALAITMAVLDGAIVNVALPQIARELNVSSVNSIWIVNAYQLATAIALLPLAAVGEIVGFRRVYQAGLLVFTLGSLGCALSHSLAALTAARVFQGLGAAGVLSMNGALVRYTYPARMLGRGIGVNALVIAAAAGAGPSVASAILSVASWEWLFAVNVPIGILTLVVAAFALPESPRSGRRFDWISGGLNALTLGLFILGTEGLAHGKRLTQAVLEMAAGLVAGAVLFGREFPRSRPLVPFDLLRIPVFSLSVTASIASFTAQMLAYVALPFYFETGLARTAVQTGLLMTPWPVATGIAAWVAGRLVERFPAAILGVVGLTAFALGLIALAFMPVGVGDLDIGWRMALCGAGFGFFQAPNNRTMMGSAPRERSGAAGGMLATARLIGQTLGASGVALLFRYAPAGGLRECLLAGVALSVLGSVASVARLRAAPSLQSSGQRTAPLGGEPSRGQGEDLRPSGPGRESNSVAKPQRATRP